MQAPNVNKERLVTKLLDLLNMKDIGVTEEEMQQQAQQQQAMAAQMQQAQGQAQPPSAALNQPSPDTIATGGLPPGLEPPTAPMEGGGPGSTLPNELRGLLET